MNYYNLDTLVNQFLHQNSSKFALPSVQRNDRRFETLLLLLSPFLDIDINVQNLSFLSFQSQQQEKGKEDFAPILEKMKMLQFSPVFIPYLSIYRLLTIRFRFVDRNGVCV